MRCFLLIWRAGLGAARSGWDALGAVENIWRSRAQNIGFFRPLFAPRDKSLLKRPLPQNSVPEKGRALLLKKGSAFGLIPSPQVSQNRVMNISPWIFAIAAAGIAGELYSADGLNMVGRQTQNEGFFAVPAKDPVKG